MLENVLLHIISLCVGWNARTFTECLEENNSCALV